MRRAIGRQIREGVRHWFVLALRTEKRTKRDLRAEVHAHVDARIEYLVAHGMSPAAARTEAEERFGDDLDAALALLEASAVARDRRLNLRERIASFAHDARYVVRGLRRAPVFSAGVIATFALGLGVNSAVFRIADRVLMRAPSGVIEPWSLRRANTMALASASSGPAEGSTFSYPQSQAIAGSHAFTRASAYANARGLRMEDGREIAGVYVDSGYFTLLGTKPAAGRFFEPREAEPGAELPVIVVSYDFWQREMGGAGLETSAPLKIGRRTYQVIGVTPRGFIGLDLDPADVWIPLGAADLGSGTINGTPIPWYRLNMLRGMRVIGRVPPNGNDTRADAQASAAIIALNAETPSPVRSIVLRSIVAASDASGVDTSGPLLGRLAGVAIVVLLITCANAANLLLARALRRRQEIAVRLALGAARARIMRLLLVESVVLGVAGGAAAGLVGYWTGDALRRLLFPDGKWTMAALDNRTLYFTVGIALAAGLAAGLAPALQLSNPDLVSGLKSDRRTLTGGGHSTRSLLVVLQVACSLALLISSGLLVRSLQRLNAVNMGFQPEGLVTTELGWLVSAPGPTNSRPSTARVDAAGLAERLDRYRGVKGVALASNAPFGSHSMITVSVPGEPPPDTSAHDGPWYTAVSANFFSVMGTRVLKGRAFNEHDRIGSQPVAIVNASMARLYWHDANPFHSCLLAHQSCAQVVGIVEDIRDTRGGGPASPRYYLSLAQQDDSTPMFTANAVLVRTSAEGASAVAAAVKSLIPAGQRTTTESIGDRIGRTMRPWRLATLLFLTLGALAVILAGIGVYSVMNFIASERTHELGVRIALGATAGDIVRLVLRNGLHLVGTGAAIGVVVAALGTRLLTSLLFGVSSLDPLVYIAAVVTFAAIGVLATIMPAMRVMRTDPTVALRVE